MHHHPVASFIAAFQIFAASIAAAPVTALALPGIAHTAVLFLRLCSAPVPRAGMRPTSPDLSILPTAISWFDKPSPVNRAM